MTKVMRLESFEQPFEAGESAKTIAFYTTSIVEELSAELWGVEDGHQVKRSVSCLVEPEVGDKVLVMIEGEERTVISIIGRTNRKKIELSSSLGAEIEVKANSFSLMTKKDIEFKAMGGINLSAPLGLIKNISESFMNCVQSSLVSISSTAINKTKNYQLNAEETIITRARTQSITAEKDFFIDADRINMG